MSYNDSAHESADEVPRYYIRVFGDLVVVEMQGMVRKGEIIGENPQRQVQGTGYDGT